MSTPQDNLSFQVDEEKRLLFLLQKKQEELQKLKHQETQILSVMIQYRDQLKKIRTEKQTQQWIQADKKEQKRQQMLHALSRRIPTSS